jgi:hypothetical protein
MQFHFTDILRTLGADFAFRVVNEARPANAYLLASILPEMPMPSYEVKDATMTVRSAMAGLSGMDSPYPPTGVVDVSTFLERSAKISNKVVLSEEAIRTLQEMLTRLQVAGQATNERMVEEVLNFTNAVIVQPHLDVAEWLRCLAVATGAISWTFGNVALDVDYNIPTANKLTSRSGNDAYAGSTSKFWTDIRAQNKLLRGSSRIIRIAHPDLIEDILANSSVNAAQVVDMTDNAITIRKYETIGGNTVPSSDVRDTVEIIKYGMEGEVIDPTDTTSTQTVPFWPRNKLVAIGTAVNRNYMVGAGSRQPQEYELGYTHLAPTVEAGGTAGRWARVYTPESRPWQLAGEGVTNMLPVINARSVNRIVIATSTVSS